MARAPDDKTKGPAPAATPGEQRVTQLRSTRDVERYLTAVAEGRDIRALDLPHTTVEEMAANGKEPDELAPYELAARLGVPVAEPAALTVSDSAVDTIPAPVARRLGVLPLVGTESHLAIAASDPANQDLSSTLDFSTPRRIVPVLAARNTIQHALRHYFDKIEDEELLSSLGLSQAARGNPDAELALQEAERLSNERPMVKLIGDMIVDAIGRRASDIHVRPGEDDVELLYRIDGELVPVRRFMRALLPAIVGRIKIIGGMNVAERRMPQDGRATISDSGEPVDCRISILPTVNGESVVIRLLSAKGALRRIEDVGFNPRDEQLFRDLLLREHGLFLVTGPTGCGKSTTLYAALQETKKQNLNIITVEDPVEFHIAGIEQVQVHQAIGNTFARTLRNILRHDPDVVMIGEIRDRETAQIAVESALTGHLVLSTLHTNSAALAVTRLLDLGVEPFLLRSTLMAVLAQRLARRNCPHCRVEERIDPHIREVMGVAPEETFYVGTGCERCDGIGVHGRVAVYELLMVGAEQRKLIVPDADADAIHRRALAEGMVEITEHALRLARAGTITLGEAFRVRVE